MKWTNDLDQKLANLINQNKKHKEISKILNTTIKSVATRCFRLKLKIKTITEFTCLICGKIFVDFVSNNRKFCSHRCSAKYCSPNRKHSNQTKEKIKMSLIQFHKDKPKIIKIIKTTRICKCCQKEKHIEKRKQLCNDCRIIYYKFYRPLCEFKFNIYNYPEQFNLDIVKKYGMYSPTNKRNNLNGVSKDHMYSVKDGFINHVNPHLISHPANCQLMLHSDNNKKKTQSSITLDSLIQRINNWNNK